MLRRDDLTFFPGGADERSLGQEICPAQQAAGALVNGQNRLIGKQLFLLFCPARIMGNSGLESISNWLRVCSWAKTSHRSSEASSMISTGVCFRLAVSRMAVLMVCVSRARELVWPSTSKPLQICLRMSAMGPVVATTETTLYCEG